MREGKMIWGKEIARVSPFNLEALKLFWCLKDLKTVEGRVLEVGCGGGGMSKVIKFYRPDLKITSCDIDQKAINWAKKNPRGVKFKVADAYSLPFDDQYFSAVLTFDFLEHLEKPEKAIAEVHRVLKQGGLFYNFVPLEKQPGTLYWLLTFFGWQWRKELAGHAQNFDLQKIKLLLETSGFALKSIHHGYHWCFQLLDITHYLRWQRLKRRPFGEKKLYWLKKVFAPIFNFESLLFFKIPGGGVSLGAVKEGDG